MGPENEETVGRRLVRMLEDINALIPKAQSEDLEKLKKTRKELLDRIGTLVESNLNRASQEYQEAADGLGAASAAIRRAIAGMESVAKAVAAIAKAVELIAKLAPA